MKLYMMVAMCGVLVMCTYVQSCKKKNGWDNFCELPGDCGEGEGDCDFDYQCGPGLACGRKNCRKTFCPGGGKTEMNGYITIEDEECPFDINDDCCEKKDYSCGVGQSNRCNPEKWVNYPETWG